MSHLEVARGAAVRAHSPRALCALAVCAALAVGGCSAQTGAAADAGPRLLVVTVDTLRADHVGAYGGPFPTPGFDTLAAEGVLVLEAATPTPTTAPAHASLWTGLHPWRHGVLDNAVPLADAVETVAERARAAGIPTAAFVSSFVLDARFGLAQGFDTYHFAPRESYTWRGREREAFWTRGGETTDAALAWLGEHGDRPFLVWVHYFDPHTPYAPPEGFARPPGERVSIAGKALPPGVPSFAHLVDLLRAYRGEVAYADAELRRLIEGVRALGLLEHTAIVATADHGEGLGDRGLLEHGRHLHDELLRVPLVVRAPGVPPGRRLAGAAQLEDLAPTALALLGLPVPAGLDGVDLLPWLRGAVEASPRAAAAGCRKPYRGEPELFFLREPARKWIGTLDAGGTRYRLDADPGEVDGTPAPAPARLRRLVGAAAAPAAAPVLDAETQRALRALGYLEE